MRAVIQRVERGRVTVSVKFKKLAGGGYFKIINQSVAPALRNSLNR
ncbi:MAG: hypothetical protein P8Y37_04780 [Anaerolineales bacterium]